MSANTDAKYTVPDAYHTLKQRILGDELGYEDRLDLLNHLWGIAICEGKCEGSAELAARLRDVFTEPLLKQSVVNLAAVRSARETPHDAG